VLQVTLQQYQNLYVNAFSYGKSKAKCKRAQGKAEYEHGSRMQKNPSRILDEKIKSNGCSPQDRVTALYRTHLNSGRVTSNIKKAEIKSGAFDAPHSSPAILFRNSIPVKPASRPPGFLPPSLSLSRPFALS
jgi:hypothetical protein